MDASLSGMKPDISRTGNAACAASGAGSMHGGSGTSHEDNAADEALDMAGSMCGGHGTSHEDNAADEALDIGILGGTFDPIHKGHIHIAEAALKEYGLDQVWLMPAGEPYFKSGTGVTEARLRLDMVRQCLRALPDTFECCDFEIQSGKETYTADTLAALKRLYPVHRFYFITGLDTLKQLPYWYRPDLVLKYSVILCASRESSAFDSGLAETIREISERFSSVNPDIRAIHTPELDISSTMIRHMVRDGEDISGLVTQEVYRFIAEHGLYN